MNKQFLERDEKLLNLSRVTTPDALSMEDDQVNSNDNDSELSIERKKKPHEQYIVKLKEPPQFKYAKNKFDNYLTKTSMRAITFSENK